MTEAIDGMAEVDRMWRSRPGLVVANDYLQGFLETDKYPEGYVKPEVVARGTKIANTIRSVTRHSEPIYVSPVICEIIRKTYNTLPDYVMTEQDLPCPAGLIWFAEPIALIAPDKEDEAYSINMLGHLPKVRAIGFHPWDGYTADGHHVTGDMDIQGCAIAQYLDGSENPYGRPDALQVQYCHGFVMQWGDSWHKFVATHREAGAPLNVSLSLTAITLATLAFMRQEIAHVSKERVRNKGAAQRLRKSAGTDTGTVVTLRRMAQPEGEKPGEHRTVAWSVQWMVGMHWRNQFYSSTGEHRPKLIMSYFKGPKDKPIKVGQKVFKVAR